jgi:hypothetical protein
VQTRGERVSIAGCNLRWISNRWPRRPEQLYAPVKCRRSWMGGKRRERKCKKRTARTHCTEHSWKSFFLSLLFSLSLSLSFGARAHKQAKVSKSIPGIYNHQNKNIGGVAGDSILDKIIQCSACLCGWVGKNGSSA